MKSSDKVFCKDCVFYRKPLDSLNIGACSAPGNSRVINTWYESRRVGQDCPSEINKNNDCSWFLKSGS